MIKIDSIEDLIPCSMVIIAICLGIMFLCFGISALVYGLN